MKDLEQFSENMLEKMAVGEIYPTVLEQAALARIALAAKQVKPVNYPCEKCKGSGFMDSGGTQPWGDPISVECDCTTTQSVHTEPDGWASSRTANDALVMLDRIETTDPADDDRIEGIKRIIRQFTTAPVNSQVIQDGWKSVPVTPTDKMLLNAMITFEIDSILPAISRAESMWEQFLAAAPNPE